MTRARHSGLGLVIAALFTAALAAGCGGGGTLPSGSVVNSPGGSNPPPTNLVKVKVTVTVPAQTRKGVRPDYISENTESLVIELSSVDGKGVTGVNPTTINTTPKARDCKVETGATVCSATASGSPGADVFAVTTFSGTSGHGNVLSSGTVQAKIQSGGGGVQISNQLSLSVGGIIASIKLSLSPKSGKRGTPMKSSVDLAAYDASGAEIVGPSEYALAITLAIQGDTAKAFLLHAGSKSGSSLTIVRPTSGITLAYDGSKEATTITLQATTDGSGSVGASANFTLHGKTPPPPVGTIYVLNLGAKGTGQGAIVTEYSGNAKGNAAPQNTLSLDSKLFARSITVDSAGNLYVGYLDTSTGVNPGTGQPDAANEIAVYAPGATGSAEPMAIVNSKASPNDSTLYPVYIAIDPSGRLVTYGATNVDGNSGSAKGAVLTYANGASGSVDPLYAFNFASPYIKYNNAGPTGLAIDSSNNFYVNGKLVAGFSSDYGLYVAAAADIGNANASAARTIPWDSITELAPGFTTNVSLDPTGEIYVGNVTTHGSGGSGTCQAQVNVYAAGASGGTTDVPPIRVLTLDGVSSSKNCQSNALLGYFPEITLYQQSVFVADVFNNAIDEFTSSDSGTVKPSLQITGPSTQLSAPAALAIASLSGQAKARPANPR